MNAPRFVQAWHGFIGAGGELSATGGKRVTVGVTAEGAIHLTGEALADGAPLGAAAADHLAGALASASATARAMAARAPRGNAGPRPE